ncbi:MAG TPA: hypothetical protein PLY45_04360, partial [bacterium]|nr:hypothetical protein [bacterium]
MHFLAGEQPKVATKPSVRSKNSASGALGGSPSRTVSSHLTKEEGVKIIQFISENGERLYGAI